ncbi:Protein FAM166C [Frankliniella fusca]|uniref:Protein FAM166C n=1 Tax=Frankliniella fusca TaxID=407009 RepID=A0AAE1LBX0_9NEOP|nr:Protein FAM166C [Frankliniella fusca]
MGGSGATALLTSSADSHLPVALRPTFMGSRPPVHQGYGSLISRGSPYGGELFFHDYRNEAAVRAAMPPYLYGCERTPYSARPDMVAADRVGNWERMLHQRQTPCSWIAPAQRAETDAFYMVRADSLAYRLPCLKSLFLPSPLQLCQQHRDQLRDHSGRLHPLDFFDIAATPSHCPVDMFTTYQRYPLMFSRYREPQPQPLTFGRTLAIPALPARSLVGRYNQYSDTMWKGSSKAMFT